MAARTPDPDFEVALADRLDAVLPQTQCAQCGYAGCRPYAEAIARGEAAINQCAPGGALGVSRLAHLTGQRAVGLDPRFGTEAPLQRAVIDEARCIGCTLCIEACPVDAIAGGARAMHAVLGERCTGCRLCVAPCPVDCILMVDAGHPWDDTLAGLARLNFETRNRRRSLAARRRREARNDPLPGAGAADRASSEAATDEQKKRATIDAALARARARRASRGPRPA